MLDRVRRSFVDRDRDLAGLVVRRADAVEPLHRRRGACRRAAAAVAGSRSRSASARGPRTPTQRSATSSAGASSARKSRSRSRRRPRPRPARAAARRPAGRARRRVTRRAARSARRCRARASSPAGRSRSASWYCAWSLAHSGIDAAAVEHLDGPVRQAQHRRRVAGVRVADALAARGRTRRRAAWPCRRPSARRSTR